jgi:archaetidylinositol phosphate synthase
VEIERRNRAWLATNERRMLRWIAARLPAAVTPDMLTAFGLFGAAVAAAGYALAARHPVLLWLATAGIAANWLGDSLDGNLARVRRIERPRYGFFIDNAVDLIAQAMLAAGLGLSGYVHWRLAMAGLAAFFMLSMLSLIRAQVSRVFDIAYIGIGLTEVRLILATLNAAIFYVPPSPVQAFGMAMTYPNVLAVVWIAANIAIFLAVVITDGARLAAEDRPRPVRGLPRSAERRTAPATDALMR